VEDLDIIGEGNWTSRDTWFGGRKKAFEVWLRLPVWPKTALEPGKHLPKWKVGYSGPPSTN